MKTYKRYQRSGKRTNTRKKGGANNNNLVCKTSIATSRQMFLEQLLYNQKPEQYYELAKDVVKLGLKCLLGKNRLYSCKSRFSNTHNNTRNKKDIMLISRFENNKEVKHQILIGIKSSNEYLITNYKDLLLNEGLLITSKSDIDNMIICPLDFLSNKQYMCSGLSPEFLVDSMIYGADIILSIYEDGANIEQDMSRVAGGASLIIKENAIEVDGICSQIGYGNAGKILMNTIFKIASILGKKYVELLSVDRDKTIGFYKKLGFNNVNSENNFAKNAKYKIPLRHNVEIRKQLNTHHFPQKM